MSIFEKCLKKEGEDSFWINTDDARYRGISNGDRVTVYNEHGRLHTVAKITDRIMPGVAGLDAGAWNRPGENYIDDGGCVNVFTKDEMSTCGAFACNCCLVRIRLSSVR